MASFNPFPSFSHKPPVAPQQTLVSLIQQFKPYIDIIKHYEAIRANMAQTNHFYSCLESIEKEFHIVTQACTAQMLSVLRTSPVEKIKEFFPYFKAYSLLHQAQPQLQGPLHSIFGCNLKWIKHDLLPNHVIDSYLEQLKSVCASENYELIKKNRYLYAEQLVTQTLSAWMRQFISLFKLLVDMDTIIYDINNRRFIKALDAPTLQQQDFFFKKFIQIIKGKGKTYDDWRSFSLFNGYSRYVSIEPRGPFENIAKSLHSAILMRQNDAASSKPHNSVDHSLTDLSRCWFSGEKSSDDIDALIRTQPIQTNIEQSLKISGLLKETRGMLLKTLKAFYLYAFRLNMAFLQQHNRSLWIEQAIKLQHKWIRDTHDQATDIKESLPLPDAIIWSKDSFASHQDECQRLCQQIQETPHYPQNVLFAYCRFLDDINKAGSLLEKLITHINIDA
jgi:hypothetical protein